MKHNKGNVLWWVVIVIAVVVIAVLVYMNSQKSPATTQTASVVGSQSNTPALYTDDATIDAEFAAIDAQLKTVDQDNASINASLNDSQPNFE